MALISGTKLGPYEIQSLLGAGGMGEVYRARDTRLERTVAIKILPAQFSTDTIRKQRFEREAKTISGLNHPNICTLYDIGHQDGVDYIVMECVEGETLAKRLERGALPLDQVLKYGAHIADALDQAHRNGVVHRDLKPGNIMLTPTGAKLLDFGLAKPPTQIAIETTFTADHSAAVTRPGTVLGTLPYMSPEQVEGKDLDGRSDIFSFGAVLYEMLTGQRAFQGNTSASVTAAILERNPRPISEVQPTSPPALDRIVKICLAKNPEDRWRSANDVGLQLAGLREDLHSPANLADVRQSRTSSRIAWALVLLLAGGAAWLATMQLRNPAPASQNVRVSLLPPPNWSFLVNGATLSPDGKRLAFVGVGPNGETVLWARTLATGADQQLRGTEGAILPFWSPDNTRLGFFADSKLKTTDAGGAGLPKTLCDATFGRGGTWNRQGTIVFAPDMFGVLDRVPEDGGIPQPVSKLPRAESGQAHRWPFFLPDGKHFLFSIDWSAPSDSPGNGIYVGSLDGGDPRLVTSEANGNAVFALGRLLYVSNLTLIAQPFDAGRLQLTGSALPILGQQIATSESFTNSSFSVSETGMLMFHTVADLASELDWFNPKGEQLGKVAATGPSTPRISPDGRFLVFNSDEAKNGKRGIRLYDTSRDVSTRLTDHGTEDDPSWSPDGKRLVYIETENADYSISLIGAGGSEPPEVVWKGGRVGHPSYARDAIFFSEFSGGHPNVAFISLSNRRRTILHGGAEPLLSPDGHWLLYTFSSGHPFGPDVYLEHFPAQGGRIQVSRSGGAQGAWSRDGKQIFFIAPDKKMMVVDFDASRQSVSAQRVVFQTRIIAPNFVARQYDVGPDGRFIVNSLPPGSAPPITLLTNWLEQKN